jgi:heme/copper-type cytochrome/quinol oxidase subunit 2
MKKTIRYYISLFLLFIPGLFFGVLLFVFKDHPNLELQYKFPFLPWQFFLIGIAGIIATIGGVLDWKFHRNPLNMKIPAKERNAEALALGTGGIPMFILMWLAMISNNSTNYLIPIILILIYTVVAISYDEFVFHIKRCGKEETMYHRMLVFGNGIAWLAWFHFIFS